MESGETNACLQLSQISYQCERSLNNLGTCLQQVESNQCVPFIDSCTDHTDGSLGREMELGCQCRINCGDLRARIHHHVIGAAVIDLHRNDDQRALYNAQV